MKGWIALSALLSIASAVAAPPQPQGGNFNVRQYGAVGDGKTPDTAAINRAITACAAAGGGTVTLPAGTYLSGTVTLLSHVTLNVASGATLLASDDPADFPLESDAYDLSKQIRSPLIDAHDAEDISLTGRGTIDGQGKIWWRRLELASPKRTAARTTEETAEAAKVDRGRPHLIRLVGCRDVVIERLHLKNSPEWNVHPVLCEFVRIDGLWIEAPGFSHNTDGINPESCRNVQITNCRIDTGDDCVTLKSGINELGRKMGRPDENITIQNCVMLHGHGGVTIGSEMSGGVRNVTVSNCVFQGTDNGIRIKSQRGRGGIVEGLAVSNIVMQDVNHPFTITTFYMGRDKPADTFPVNEGTPRFRDFLFSNITARGARDAGSITGLKEMPVGDITFNNVHIQSATGFTCTNARQVRFLDCRIDPAAGPAIVQVDSAEIDTMRLLPSLNRETEAPAAVAGH